MAALSSKLRDAEDGQLRFWCPGCKRFHGVYVAPRQDGKPRPQWGYNGNPERPTFTPSILVKGSELTEKGRADIDAWREAGCPERLERFESKPTVCHSFVRDGQIQFLGDCTHQLAGKTVELPDLP